MAVDDEFTARNVALNLAVEEALASTNHGSLTWGSAVVVARASAYLEFLSPPAPAAETAEETNQCCDTACAPCEPVPDEEWSVVEGNFVTGHRALGVKGPIFVNGVRVLH